MLEIVKGSKTVYHCPPLDSPFWYQIIHVSVEAKNAESETLAHLQPELCLSTSARVLKHNNYYIDPKMDVSAVQLWWQSMTRKVHAKILIVKTNSCHYVVKLIQAWWVKYVCAQKCMQVYKTVKQHSSFSPMIFVICTEYIISCVGLGRPLFNMAQLLVYILNVFAAKAIYFVQGLRFAIQWH